MKTIWKFQLKETSGIQNVHIPVNAQVLTVQEQYNKPVLWAVVEDNVAKELRLFELVITGGDFAAIKPDDERKYIGTYQTHDGHYVVHLFEIIESGSL